MRFPQVALGSTQFAYPTRVHPVRCTLARKCAHVQVIALGLIGNGAFHCALLGYLLRARLTRRLGSEAAHSWCAPHFLVSVCPGSGPD